MEKIRCRRRRRLRNKLPRWGGTNYRGEVELSTLISDTIVEREVGESENFWYFCLEVTLSTDYITPRQESYTIEPIKWVPYYPNQFMNFLYRLFHDHFVCIEWFRSLLEIMAKAWQKLYYEKASKKNNQAIQIKSGKDLFCSKEIYFMTSRPFSMMEKSFSDFLFLKSANHNLWRH